MGIIEFRGETIAVIYSEMSAPIATAHLLHDGWHVERDDDYRATRSGPFASPEQAAAEATK